MWRVMGSSPERVRVPDLGDVIYYRQVKDYSDQDYESSRDLQRAVQKGTITVIEHTIVPKSIGGAVGASVTAMTVNNTAPAMDVETLKKAIREALPAESRTTADSLREIVPSIVDMVRQEISSAMANVRLQGSEGKSRTTSDFMGPEYIPTVTTEGMTSSIKIDAKEVDGNAVASNLGLLRKLKQQSK